MTCWVYYFWHIYMKDSKIGSVPQTCPIILWRQISTWESKNKPDSIVMSNSPKHVWFGPTNVPDFTKKHYPSILCMFTILSRVSVLLLYYKTIDISEWKASYLEKTKSCTVRVRITGFSVCTCRKCVPFVAYTILVANAHKKTKLLKW